MRAAGLLLLALLAAASLASALPARNHGGGGGSGADVADGDDHEHEDPEVVHELLEGELEEGSGAELLGEDHPAEHTTDEHESSPEHDLEEHEPTAHVSVEKSFSDLDLNKDGKVTHAEVVERLKKVVRAERQQSDMQEKELRNIDEAAMRQSGVGDDGTADDPDAPQLLDAVADAEGAHEQTAEDVAAMKEEYLRMDTDKNDALEWEEVKKQILGDPLPEGDAETEDEKRQMEGILKVERIRFDRVDEDKSGSLSEGEFKDFQLKELRDVDELMEAEMMGEEVHAHIEAGDTDNDGALTMEEYKTQHENFIDITHPEHLIEMLQAHQEP